MSLIKLSQLQTKGFIAEANAATETASGGWTQIDFANEIWDSDGWYNAATSSFLPLAAGPYLICAGVQNGEHIDDADYWGIAIYKNGAIHRRGTLGQAAVNTSYRLAIISIPVVANGIDDDFDIRIFQDSGIARDSHSNGTGSWFTAIKVG